MHRKFRIASRAACALVAGCILSAGGVASADPGNRSGALPAVAPCINALQVSACERWITYGRGPARSRLYSTYRIDAYNPGLKRALILVHGANLMGGYFFRHGMAAAILRGRARQYDGRLHLFSRPVCRQATPG